MLRIIFTYIFLIFSFLAVAQKEFVINYFSEKYHAKIVSFYEGGQEKTELSMYNTGNHKELFRVMQDYNPDSEILEYLQEKASDSNVVELPYDSQNIIIYSDFNFDEINDFAIKNGYLSCYSGPSYDIYLADNKGFTYSESFSSLAQDYCGMFEIDTSKKRIYTMTKSGCCWHQYSEFIVEANEPKAINIREEAFTTYGFMEITEESWNGNDMEVTIKNYLFDEEDYLFSFRLEKNNKQVVLKSYPILTYVFAKEDNEIEYIYSTTPEDEGRPFVSENKDNSQTLSFSNHSATYTIYETDKSVGIKVKTNGKTYDMKGDKASQKGKLTDLLKIEIDNIEQK